MEAIVEFLEGDPDKPIVTGCFYNATAMPPDALPDNKTRTVFRTRFDPERQRLQRAVLRGQGRQRARSSCMASTTRTSASKHDTKEWIGHDPLSDRRRHQFEKVGGGKHLIVEGNQREKVGRHGIARRRRGFATRSSARTPR